MPEALPTMTTSSDGIDQNWRRSSCNIFMGGKYSHTFTSPFYTLIKKTDKNIDKCKKKKEIFMGTKCTGHTAGLVHFSGKGKQDVIGFSPLLDFAHFYLSPCHHDHFYFPCDFHFCLVIIKHVNERGGILWISNSFQHCIGPLFW